MKYNPLSFHGIPVTISGTLFITSSVDRTWKERLFTRPFTPFKKVKEIKVLTDIIQDGQVIKSKNGLLMNQKTFNDFKNYKQ
jgi:hypothetical protein